MGIENVTFDKLSKLNLNSEDSNFELKKEMLQTSQGLTVNEYEVFSNVNDFKSKNYTANFLTDLEDFNNFFAQEDSKKNNIPDFTTTLTVNGKSSSSAVNDLFFNPSSLKFDNDSLSFGINRKNKSIFTIDFIDNVSCKIKTTVGIYEKFAIIDESTRTVSLSVGSVKNDSLSSNVFKYNFDKDKQLIQFIKDDFKGQLNGQSLILAGVGLDGANKQLSACKPINVDDESYFKTVPYKDNLPLESVNNLVFYNNDGSYNTSSESLSDQKNNFLSYYPFEKNNFKNGDYENTIKLFNLKNHISNDNNFNSLNPVFSGQYQRNYTSILNSKFIEKEEENLLLNYIFYNKEYNFLPDKYTKFTLPDSIFPFEVLNINDSNLSKNGAYAAKSPYFSDKIFKLQSDIFNNNKIVEIENKELLLQSSGVNYILLQDNLSKLVQNLVEDPVVNDGSYLCSWLSGNDFQEGVWFDRYYNPKEVTFTNASIGSTDQIFSNTGLARKYFESNQIDEYFYDIKSNMTFTPKTTYYYQRVGKNTVKNIINKNNNRILKNTFNVNLTSNVNFNQKNIVFNQRGHDKFTPQQAERSFSITFDLQVPNLSTLNTYGIVNNLYEDGFNITNNFYLTPFIIIPMDNKLYFFNTDLQIVKINTYNDINIIKDVIFLEQNNNIILICDNKIIKTNIDGVILDQRSDFLAVNNFCGNPNTGKMSYRNRIIRNYNEATFLKHNFKLASDSTELNGCCSLNLNNLSISGSSDTYLASASSVVDTLSGVKKLSGTLGKKLTDNIGVSLKKVSYPANKNNNLKVFNTIVFENITDGSTVSNPISTNKDIYSINTYDSKLYVQAFDNLGKGTISKFDTNRQLLSTFSLNVSAASGCYVDFINENDKIKLVSLSNGVDNTLIVDKIDLDNGEINSIVTSFSSNQLILSASDIFMTPCGFENIYDKYKDKQGDLYFKSSFKTFDRVGLTQDVWSSNTISYDISASPKKLWSTTFSDVKSRNNNEKFLKLNNVKFNNKITLNFSLDSGSIEIYFNSMKIGNIIYKPNFITNENFLLPFIYFNTPVFNNKPLVELSKNNAYTNSGGSISNLRIYNDKLSEDFIKYLHLDNEKFDNLNFDIMCGTRNNIEEIENLYNFKIPGFKNNNTKIYIKNAELSRDSSKRLSDYLNSTLSKVLPFYSSKINFNYDINL